LRFTAKDRKGQIGSNNSNVSVYPDTKSIYLRTDSTIYVPGHPLYISLFSTEDSTPIRVDIVKDSISLISRIVKPKNGRASISIPFRPDFRGELNVSAGFLRPSGEFAPAGYSRSVIFPAPSSIGLDISSLKPRYKPGEQARAVFNSRFLGGGTETALGIFVIDKAIEERSRIEGVKDNLADLRRLLGTSNTVAEMSRRDLDMIDTTKPISPETQLAAEFLLSHRLYQLEFSQSRPFSSDFREVYSKRERTKLQPVVSILEKHFMTTGEIPTNLGEIKAILADNKLGADILDDPWGKPYYVRRSAKGGLAYLEFVSSSGDKKLGTDDDFEVARAEFRWFSHTLNMLERTVRESILSGHKSPETIEELTAIWQRAGIEPGRVVDLWNNPVFVTRSVEYTRTRSRPYNIVISNLGGEQQYVTQRATVEEDVVIFRVMSKGEDGSLHTRKDFELGQISVILRERVINYNEPKINVGVIPRSDPGGAISGTITDVHGAVIAGAEVSAINVASREQRRVNTNFRGDYEIAELPAGKYAVRASAYGFTVTEVINIVVVEGEEVRLVIQLEVGGLTEEVVVMAGREVINTSDASLSNSVRSVDALNSIAAAVPGAERSSTLTPKIREYFPETLFWQPELVTDRRGRAAINFRLGDSLTTWKLFAFGSTEDGKFGMAEKEFQTFQPLMAELDPPKILTQGDEISLPVPIRNYTNRRQSVSVKMELNSWSTLIEGDRKVADIPANSSSHVIFSFRADSVIEEGKKRVVAIAQGESDGIEKPVSVKPDGFQIIEGQTNAFREKTSFTYALPPTALAQNRKTEVKFYPNLLSNIVSSVSGLLQRPYGCGEQTTSSTYPNLLILKTSREMNVGISSDLERMALRNLRDGYERLLAYQTDSGGFSYWGRSDAPVPVLTAYVIDFLSDASEFIDVDKDVITRAAVWLAAQQKPDGSWSADPSNNNSSTAFIVRSLLSVTVKKQSLRENVLKGFQNLRTNFEGTDDAFVLASYALAANELGENEAAREAALRLAEIAVRDGDSIYWKAPSTPFFGWGRAAEIETTALAIRAIIGVGLDLDAAKSSTLVSSEAIVSGGLMYLLHNKDRFGVWHSTQTTVNVLNALIALHKSIGPSGHRETTFEVFVNGRSVKRSTFNVESPTEPLSVDISEYVSDATNTVEIVSPVSGMYMAQTLVQYYVDWSSVRVDSEYFDLKVAYDKTTANISEVVTCEVGIVPRSTGIRGMILSEIGVPPGSDIDRESLEAAQREKSISGYDILPDRVVVYMWARAGGTKFSFKFRPRYGINAQTPASVVYDYYNPEAQAISAPVRFLVR
jgi:hypothetical protein